MSPKYTHRFAYESLVQQAFPSGSANLGITAKEESGYGGAEGKQVFLEFQGRYRLMEVGGEEEIQGLQARIAKLLKVRCELFVLVCDGKILN